MANSQDVTVWASFVYLRGGEHVPPQLQDGELQLTPLGAAQMQSAGQFFRDLYLEDTSSSRIARVDATQPLMEQVSAITLADQPLSASAQAFMLGMWPPNSTVPTGPNAIAYTMANGTTMTNPLGGIQFPMINVVDQNDIESIFVRGDLSCNGFSQYEIDINPAANLVEVEQNSRATYFAVQNILDPVFPEADQTFNNAKTIFDYVNFQNTHNSSVATQLSSQPGVLDQLRYYADAQQQGLYGDLHAGNPYWRTPQVAKYGSISTIAGASLAWEVGNTLYAQSYAVGSATPLSIVVGDYAPLTSIFPLLNLTIHSPNFAGLALPGSAAVFELVSQGQQGTTSTGIPAPEDLQVRFRFRNGTGLPSSSSSSSSPELSTYPIFTNTDASVYTPYSQFLSSLKEISIAGPGDWCYQCGATSLFCSAWNATDGYLPSSSTVTNVSKQHGLSPVAAGAIGALTTLCVTALLGLVAVWILGLRVKRSEPLWATYRRRREGSLGKGFKGNAKLASDADLPSSSFEEARAADGSVLGAQVLEKPVRTHGRDGSWEMKASPRMREDEVWGSVGGGRTGSRAWATGPMSRDDVER